MSITPSQPTETMHGDLTQTATARQLFWHNVMRDMLTSLSVMSMRMPPPDKLPEGAETIFDGRLAVLTHAGERIPIAQVYPLFACSVNGSPGHRALSMAVQCSVFQIRTPTGEVFTLPLHEMRGFHALSSELMEQIKEEMPPGEEGAEDDGPFGFAAFTSLARQQLRRPDVDKAKG